MEIRDFQIPNWKIKLVGIILARTISLVNKNVEYEAMKDKGEKKLKDI